MSFVDLFQRSPSAAKEWIRIGVGLPDNASTITIGNTAYTKEDCFICAVNMDGSNVSGWVMLGLTIPEGKVVGVGRWGFDKRKCFIKAVELDSDCAVAWSLLGMCMKDDEQVTIRRGGKDHSFSRRRCLEFSTHRKAENKDNPPVLPWVNILKYFEERSEGSFAFQDGHSLTIEQIEEKIREITAFDAKAANEPRGPVELPPLPPSLSRLTVRYGRGRLLGRGASGEVYEAVVEPLVPDKFAQRCPRDVAVKRVRLGDIEEDEDVDEGRNSVVAEAKREIDVMANLSHGNVVKYYFSQIVTDQTNGSRYLEIFMEKCDGGSLAKQLRGNAGNVDLHRRWVTSILEGLSYLHSQRVVHRDLKPANIFLKDNIVKLGDFGCSKTLATLTMTATTVGTPMFMAPEVFGIGAERTSVGPAADIWSVGCVLLSMMGLQPWIVEGEGEVYYLIRFRLETTSHMPDGVPERTACPDTLWHFFERVFERDPTKRATCSELLGCDWINETALRECM